MPDALLGSRALAATLLALAVALAVVVAWLSWRIRAATGTWALDGAPLPADASAPVRRLAGWRTGVFVLAWALAAAALWVVAPW